MAIRSCLVGALAAAVLTWAAQPALAANFVVNSGGTASDAAPGDGVCEATTGLADCTVQAAVQESNALAGNDAIVLPAGDFLADPFLDIQDAVIVAGAGAASTAILGNGTETVLYFYVNVDVTLVGVTVAGGNGGNVGGGITISGGGRLTLIDCVIRDNTTVNVGGGVYVDHGQLLMVGTTVTGNSAGNVGGGVYVGPGCSGEIVNSTISGNYAGNTSGGIGNEGHTTLNNVTVVGNSCGNVGAGVDNDFDGDPSLEIANSILADNFMVRPFGGAFPEDCLGDVTTRGYNLIEKVNGTLTGPGVGTDLLAQDPALGPLADNGGPTPTHSLPSTSPAVNAGNPNVPGTGGASCAATDQRGIDRPSGLRCDIGAFELARCGNGVLDPEEECDDGSNVDDDGCDSNCTVTRCGNGVVTSGEECDDANTLDGDCCSSACALEPLGSLVEPAPAGATFAMKRDGKLQFKWKGRTAMPTTVFGDPTANTDVSICLLDTTGATPTLVASARVHAGAGWKASTAGFSYKGGSAAPGTLSRLTLHGGSVAKIAAKGLSPRLRPGRLPLVTPVTVVIRTSTGSTVFGAAFDGAKQNRMNGFKARTR